MNLDKYINILFIKLSQKYKVNIITIMSYNNKYKRTNKTYKLVIDSKKKKIERVSLDFTSKRALVLEMMKWTGEQN
jgi:hypothetical protein